ASVGATRFPKPGSSGGLLRNSFAEFRRTYHASALRLQAVSTLILSRQFRHKHPRRHYLCGERRLVFVMQREVRSSSAIERKFSRRDQSRSAQEFIPCRQRASA